MKQIFSVIIKLVFLFAFAAFLLASIHHIAAFFYQFEPGDSGQTGSYFLAIAIDGTSLMLTIGMMFFAEEMPVYAKCFVWFFILLLTGFSWLVNWEYAVVNQSANWGTKLPPIMEMINPILASSFAFLNLAYSVVSEFFGAKQKTMEQLQKELEALSGRAEIERQIKEAKGPGFIAVVRERALEVKAVASEVLHKEESPANNQTPSTEHPANTSSKLINDDLFAETKQSSKQTPFDDSKLFELVEENNLANESVFSTKQTIDTILFDDPNIFIDTGENDSVYSDQTVQQTPKERITIKLTEQPSEQTRDTDKLAPSNKNVRPTKQHANTLANGEAAKRVLRILQKNKDINVTELAIKAKVSKGYASQVRTDYKKNDKVSA